MPLTTDLLRHRLVRAALLLGLAAAPGSAQERVVRAFGQEHGLTAAPVWDLA